MQPDGRAVLNGVKNIIVNILLPELQTDQSRQQALYATILLDHVVARGEIEGALLLEERAELQALLTQAADALTAAPDVVERIRAALDTPPAAAGPQAVDAANERMRSLVPVLARALRQRRGAHLDAPLLEVDAALRSYVRNQHRRDEQLVQVGALSW